MLEECVGKEQFEKCAMKMASVLEGCMKKQPEEYLMNKIDMSELVIYLEFSTCSRPNFLFIDSEM